MRSMKNVLLVFLLGFIQPVVLAVGIAVGTTELNIPAPTSYSPIASNMQPYWDFIIRFVTPSNELLAMFLPDHEVALVTKGAMSETERYFVVQAPKTHIQAFISTADFNAIKQVMKAQNSKLVKKAENRMAQHLKGIEKGISEDYQVEMNMAIKQVALLPPHYESERCLAYSMMKTHVLTGESGKPSNIEGVVTVSFVHLKGKVLFLYANAEKSGLEWSRAESKKWANTIIAENPSMGNVALREAAAAKHGFNWTSVGKNAILGAVIGGIIGIFRMRNRKGRIK
jgi:hypothetical protein